MVYMTLHDVFPVRPKLGVSVDGGHSWTIRDIEAGIGAVTPMLAAVDPVDASRVYLRVLSAAGAPLTDGLAITADGGLTWTTPLTVSRGSLAGMARVSERLLVLVGTTAPPATGELGVPALFRSSDGGATFTTESLSLHPFGIALRQGTIFAATKDNTDGFALASSPDGGHTWTPRLRLREITRVKECVRVACQDTCDRTLAGLVFPPEVCNPPPPAPPSGGGCGCVVSRGQDGAGVPSDMAALIVSLVTWMAAARPGHRTRRRDRT
jgi:hypothetical protein